MPAEGKFAMEHRHWVDALDRHAEALSAGADLTAPLLAVAAPKDRGLLGELLDTARRVRATLATQPAQAPRPDFVAQLKARLAATPRLAPGRRPPTDRRTLVWWAAGVGGVISAAGLGFLAYRAIGTGVSGMMAGRAARPALPKAQPAP